MLYVAPNPESEIDERLHGTVPIWIALLLFSGTPLAAAWWCADRALAPVRALEVRDGGHGLAPDGPAWQRSPLGMTARVAMADGQLRLVGVPAGGPRLLATLPLAPAVVAAQADAPARPAARP